MAHERMCFTWSVRPHIAYRGLLRDMLSADVETLLWNASGGQKTSSDEELTHVIGRLLRSMCAPVPWWVSSHAPSSRERGDGETYVVQFNMCLCVQSTVEPCSWSIVRRVQGVLMPPLDLQITSLACRQTLMVDQSTNDRLCTKETMRVFHSVQRSSTPGLSRQAAGLFLSCADGAAQARLRWSRTPL